VVNQAAVAELQKRHILKKGDWVILTKGDLMGVHGKTNAMKIIAV
ncbi:MAG TPA: pyruvate kinase alpha/beta domain-containing protein, partial [Gammaproteobacteria bacterium]|nr:pyruvate kinase alpha/beta domain-containing protein [Gammaproteobacteria bacterium]